MVLRRSGRPLAEIAAQPTFITAVIAAMVGYGVMSLVMTATPIAMLGCGYAFTDAAFVLQWHALGMYRAELCDRASDRALRGDPHSAGRCGAVAACCGVNLAGIAVANFWVANVALGVGWNFLFVGATTLLTRTYTPEEKGKVQALNDFLVFGTVAVSSFASGALLSGVGWSMVQVAVMPPVVVAAAFVLWWRWRSALATPRFAGS